MVNIYLESFWLALPAFAANMAPVIVQKLHAFEKLNVPIDGGKSLFGKRIFGEHKTVRGLLIGTLAGIFIVAVQYAAVNFFELPFAHLHSLTEFLLFGALSGFGALMGDAIESFFKRQIGIGSGRPFIPFDQIDYILGFLLCTELLISWKWQEVVFLLLCGAVLNPLINFLSYLTGIKKTYW